MRYLLDKLPYEIEDYIMDMKYSLEHRERLNKIKPQLEFKAICNLLYSLTGFEWFNYITIEQSIHYMDLLSNCKCCLEHQKRRPTTQMYIDGFVPEYSTTAFKNDKSCKCKCRHLARSLCREKNDVEVDI